MEQDPARRYGTVTALEADLRAFLEGRPVSAVPVNRIGRLYRWVERHKRLIAWTSAGVLTLVVVAGILWLMAARSSRQSAAAAALAEARQAAREYAAIHGRLPELETRLVEKRRSTLDSEEYAARQAIFAIATELTAARERADEQFEAARLAAEGGLQIDRDNRELRQFLVKLIWERYLSSETTGRDEETVRLREQLSRLVPESQSLPLIPRGTASIRSEPAGAEVQLFRYRASGPLLQPVPYRPGHGDLLTLDALPVPRLRIFRSPGELLASFGLELDDRILKVQGRPIDASGPRLLARLDQDGVWLELEIERRGKVDTWRLPSRSGGKSTVQALAACLEGDAFPLAMLTGGACGVTPTEPLELDGGSYLAVLRLAGHRDTRLPFVVTRNAKLDLKVNLFTDDELGPDFVHVPAGQSPVGGDPQAHYAEPERLVSLDDYFIGKYEVTFREYFEFLNDPVVASGIGEWGVQEKDTLLPFNLVRGKSSPLFERRADGTLVLKSGLDSNSPVLWISRTAAKRFVEWRNELEARRGGSLTHVLPSADELEKAARGVDRRQFPWGNRFDWSLVLSFRTRSNSRPFKFPTDASPYDVRDLAGSLSELTSTDESPTDAFDRTGFRLAAYPSRR